MASRVEQFLAFAAKVLDEQGIDVNSLANSFVAEKGYAPNTAKDFRDELREAGFDLQNAVKPNSDEAFALAEAAKEQEKLTAALTLKSSLKDSLKGADPSKEKTSGTK